MTPTIVDSTDVNHWLFSTNDLPADCNNRSRARAWQDIWEHTMKVPFDIDEIEEGPFLAEFDIARVGELVVYTGQAKATQITRSHRQLPKGGADHFFLNLNEGNHRIELDTPRGRSELRGGMLGITAASEPLKLRKTPGAPSHIISVSGATLAAMGADPHDFTRGTLDHTLPATRLLRGYSQLLFKPQGLESDPELGVCVSQTFHDLLALALGAKRDETELAKNRGGRAAKLKLILEGIKDSFADPAFTERALAAKHGISPRSIRDLLHETGKGFSERVLELRLSKARDMLRDPNCRTLRVADIAYACGFNEVPYFNRRFRQRFGATPTSVRA